MIEVDNPDDLPPYPVLVRRGPSGTGGRAVAAYRTEDAAAAHAAPLEDASIWKDRCTGLRQHEVWKMALRQRERDQAAVEALAARWLTGDWWTPGGPPSQ